MPYKNCIVITGPTTSGKTDIAFEIAAMEKGDLVNSDKFMMYRDFPNFTGLVDVKRNSEIEWYKNVGTHLYEFLDIDQDIDAEEYKKLAGEAAKNVSENGGKIPIFEGCYMKFLNTLIGNGYDSKITYPATIGIKRKGVIDGDELKGKVRDRVEMEVTDETVADLEKILCEENSFLASKSVAIVPLKKYIDGKLILPQAKDTITNDIIELAKRQYLELNRNPMIKWFEYNGSVPETADQIVRFLREEAKLFK